MGKSISKILPKNFRNWKDHIFYQKAYFFKSFTSFQTYNCFSDIIQGIPKVLDSQEVKPILLPRRQRWLQGTQFLCSFQPLGNSRQLSTLPFLCHFLWHHEVCPVPPPPKKMTIIQSHFFNSQIIEEKFKVKNHSGK